MKHLFCALFVLATTFLFGAIVEIKELSEINKYLAKDELIIFDLDNTLIEPRQTLGSDQWFYNRIQELEKNGKSSQDAFSNTYSEWFQIQCVTKVKPVEKNTVNMLKDLQKYYKVIALTTRSFDLNFTTLLQLDSVGIDFTKSSLTEKMLFFDGEKYVAHKKGVLFANGSNKGNVLKMFFEKINYEPSKIIFIDDKESNLKDVKEFCEKNKIEFTGLRYGYLDEKVKNFNRQIVQKQHINFDKFLINEEVSVN